MDYLIICITSFLVATLTLFSGFGLGTLLLPAFSIFFSIEIAVAAIFSLFELIPSLQQLCFSKKNIPLGGALSGFFGGLSGLQGALRTMFLIRAGRDKNQFIGTKVVSSTIE